MLNFNLIDNALDSLEHAIGHLTQPKELEVGDYKRVIMDLSHVTELLFKEHLRATHPAFVLSNVDNYPSKTAHTVSAAKASQRVQTIGGVHFNKTDLSALKTIRDKRNEIEHYKFNIQKKEAKVVIGNVLVFIFRFAHDELGLNWADRQINDPAWTKLNEYAEFYEVQRKYILKTLVDSAIPIMDCPMCHNNTFDLDTEVCLLCGHREEVLECSSCKEPYLYSNVEHENANLCPECEWKDGYAAANCEKY